MPPNKCGNPRSSLKFTAWVPAEQPSDSSCRRPQIHHRRIGGHDNTQYLSDPHQTQVVVMVLEVSNDAGHTRLPVIVDPAK